MKILENNKIYRMDRDGKISFALIEDHDEDGMLVFGGGHAISLEGKTEIETEDGLRYENGDSYMEFSPLTLEAAPEVFKNTIRVFNDLAVLETFARREIHLANSYTVNTVPDEVISFTVNDEDNVLALIKTTEDGDLFKWEGEDWVQLGEDEEDPSVFEQEVIDVERVDIENAINLWKSGQPLTKEDILPLAALVQ